MHEAKRNVKEAESQEATCTKQTATCKKQNLKKQRAQRKKQRARSKTQEVTCTKQKVTCKKQKATCKKQISRSNVQDAKSISIRDSIRTLVKNDCISFIKIYREPDNIIITIMVKYESLKSFICAQKRLNCIHANIKFKLTNNIYHCTLYKCTYIVS